MAVDIREIAPPVVQPSLAWMAVRREWQWWLPAAIAAFLLASVLMSGWPAGLVPNLSHPYTYQGDGLSHSWLIQRVIEGWTFDNPRSGYPFGSDFRDYPGSDAGNLIILKLLGLITGNYGATLNLYFLLGFPLTLFMAYICFRSINISKWYALAASLVFIFLPFHFLRLTHLFYTWYFVVPVFFYIGFFVYQAGQPANHANTKRWHLFAVFLGLCLIASFGIYYAAFGMIVIATAGLSGWLGTGSVRSGRFAAAAILMIMAGVLLNTAPNIINKARNGANPEVGVRPAADAEIYGLKLIQLLLPRQNHRIKHFSETTDRYNGSHPLTNENAIASLGIVGTAGLLALFIVIAANLSGRRVDERLTLLALVGLVLFLFGTIGGLGSAFSSFVSSSIRGWNRISVFIAFGAIAAFFIALQLFAKRFVPPSKKGIFVFVSAVSIAALGLYDQTTSACVPCNLDTKRAYELDKSFVQQIESTVPPGSAIYQLPYMPFPEVPVLNRLHAYDLAAGFLHSHSLRWSYAGMKGRAGDLFFKALAKEKIEKQVDVLRRLGFTGIYIDRRGYEDNADALMRRLSGVLGESPTLTRADGEVVFFQLRPLSTVDLKGLSATSIMQKAGYFADGLGARYPAALSDGIDFTRNEVPDFVGEVRGLSGAEPWGRWSDANLAPSVKISLLKPLPDKFTLILKAQAFGPNVGRDLLLRVGSKDYFFRMPSGIFETRIPVDSAGVSVDRIELTPPEPMSPRQLGISPDGRKLGIGLIQLLFEE